MNRTSISDIANRISCSVSRRHGVARHVIAVIMAACALVGVAFGVYALSVKPVSLMTSDGLALPSDDAADALVELASSGTSAPDISPVSFDAGDALWEEFSGLSVGEHRTPISGLFPLFLSDGAAVDLSRSQGTLVTRFFDELEPYPGLIVSEGGAYTQAGRSSDADAYRFLKVRGNVYVLLQTMHLAAQSVNEVLPCGSLVALTESAVSWYRLGEGSFVPGRLTVFPQATTVSFGPDHEDSQTYDALLRALGLLSDPAAAQKPSKEDDSEDEQDDRDREREAVVEQKTPVEHSFESEEVPFEQNSSSGGSQGSGEPGAWEWVRPEARADSFKPSVYQATSHLFVNDPAGVISRPVRFEFRRGGTLYMRASFNSGGALTVGGLEANTTYDIVGVITYRDQDGREVEEDFFTQSITTGDPSRLDPMRITFKQGSLFPERLEFTQVAFAGGSRELLANATGMSFEVDGKSFALSAELRAKMLTGEQVSLKTSASFEPDSEYQVTLAAQDRSGNPLPLRVEPLVMRTCKERPKARLRIAKNEANNLSIGVDLDDPQAAISGEASLELYDEAGVLIQSMPLEVGNHEYSFGELGYSRILRAEVTCSYDLSDGNGLCEGTTVGSMDFTTVSISVLGYAVYATTVSDVGDSSAMLSVSLNTKQMDSRLVALLTNGSVSAGLEGKDPVFSHDFTKSEIKRLRSGETLQFRMSGFESMTTYKISTTAGAQIGDEQTGVYNEVKATNRVDSFKTLRRPAIVEFANTAVMSNSIMFDVRVLDLDDTTQKDVMLEVRDRFGRLMGDQLRFAPVDSVAGDGWQRQCTYHDLEKDQPYTVNVIAYDYNQGYDNGTLQGRTVLYTGEIVTTDGVSGAITLRGIDEVSGQRGKLDVRARVEIADLWNELDPHEFTIEVLRDGREVDAYSVGFEGTGQTVDLEPYRIDRMPSTYCMRLMVNHHGQRIVLSEVEFSGEHGLVGISTEQELKTLPRGDHHGHFIVLNDIATTAANVDYSNNVDRFEGSIDFQGYTITLNRVNPTPESPKRNALINYLGKDGVLKNAVLQVDGTPQGSLVYQCFGTVSNVRVTLKSPQVTDSKARTNLGGVIGDLNTGGVLENFVVNLGGDHLVVTNSGGAVVGLSGTIRNGYVYGGRLVAAEGLPSGTTLEQIGGVIGYANSNAHISNVISMVDVVAPSDNPSIEFGLVAGRRDGCAVDGVLATGNLYNYYSDTGSNANKCGPVIGSVASSITARNKNMFHLCEAPDNITSDGSALVSPLALYDRAWYEEYLDPEGALDLTPVLRECYPQVKFPAVMGVQDYLPLPERPEVHIPTITSLRVLENKDTEATVQVSLNNPDHYAITGIEVAGALCDIMSQQADVDDPSITRVTARLHVGEAQQCLSSYSIVGLTYELYDGKPSRESYKAGEYVIAVEFWRTISSVDAWIKLAGSSENFRLKADLDFEGVPSKQIYISTFSGKLDGQGHALRNISLNGTGYVFGTVKNARIFDLRVDGLSIEKVVQAGFIYNVTTGSTVENVHLSNVDLGAYERMGAIAIGVNSSSTVRDCSVTDASYTVLPSASWYVVYLGGVASFTNNSAVTNCFAQDIVVDALEADEVAGIGGVVGHIANSSNIRACYATGSVDSVGGMVGGIVGITTYGSDSIESVWSDIDIATTAGRVGGVFGRVEGATNKLIPSLAVGDVYVSGLGITEVGNTCGSLKNPDTVLSGLHYFDGHVAAGVTNDDGTPLTYEELCRPTTYTDVIGLTSFDTSQVQDGVLPKLLDSKGALMPNQRDHRIKGADDVEVTKVTAARPGNDYMVQIDIDHKMGDVVTGATFDWLEPIGKPKVLQGSETHTTLMYQNVKPLRAYDTYRLDTVEYTRDGNVHSQRVGERVFFGAPVYKTINSIEDWAKIDPSSYENYRVTGDIDFSGRNYKTGNFGVKVNRLEGVGGADGNPKFKDIDITFSTKDTDCSLISTVRSSISNLSFENIQLRTDGAKNPINGVSLIGIMLGASSDGSSVAQNGAHNISLNNAQFVAVPCKADKRYTSSYVGMIARLDGTVDGAMLTDVTIEALTDASAPQGAYYGALFGYATGRSTVRHIDADQIDVRVSAGNVGSIGGAFVSGQGEASDIQVANVKVESTQAVSSFAGGAFGRCYRVEDVTVKGSRTDQSSSVMVKGVGRNVGGILGEGHLQNAHVEGAVVQGRTYVGGMTGSGSVNHWLRGSFDVNTASTVKDSLIESIDPVEGKYAGGAIGVADSDTKNLHITGVTVRGKDYVGGYAGMMSRGQNYIVVESSTVEATGNYAGGITGSGVSWYSGVRDVSVSGGDMVGGISGYATNGGYSYVSNVRVSGNTRVGGAVGELNGRGTSALAEAYSVNASVVARAGAAGGIIGRLAPEYNAATSNASVGTSIFLGNVSGATASGGVIGELVSGINPALTRGFMVAAAVTGPAGASGVAVGRNASIGASAPDSFGAVFAHNSTSVNGIYVDAADPGVLMGAKVTVPRIVSRAEIIAGPAEGSDVTKTDQYKLYNNSETSSSSGLGFSTGNWDIASGITQGCFPQPKTNRVDGVKAVGPLQPLEKVPDDRGAIAMLGDDAPAIEGSASLSTYVSGVNTFNIDFPDELLGGSYEIAGMSNAADGAGIGNASAPLASGSIDHRTYTFAWDYSTPLTIRVRTEKGVSTFGIDPADMVRTAAVWGDNTYWLTAEGVRDLEGDLVEGAFVNLYGGRALTSVGSIVDIAEGSSLPVDPLPRGVVLEVVSEPVPIASGDGWKTFGSYGELDNGVERDVRLYPCDDGVYGISSELDTVPDGYVFDDFSPSDFAVANGGDLTPEEATEETRVEREFSDSQSRVNGSVDSDDDASDVKRFRTVLMADGTLRDLADPLVYPDGFENEGIASMTNTSLASAPLVVVRYEDGLMVCFDYTTGEVKFQKQGSGEDLGLLEYAGEFFDGLLGGLGASDVPTGDNGYGDALALEESASHGGLVGLGGGDTGSMGAAGSGSASAGPGSGSTGAGGFASGGDYISVYEPSSQGYVTYAADELLDGSLADVASVNEAHGIPASTGEVIAVTTQAPAQLGAAGLGQTGQVALFSSAVLGILAILLFI